ncbi:GNAT family N-acetyltransferase [Glaciihabitans arcticus]|uniref:GNAT family N-acetyltransferase n=1 Tax=Glaciihabitans arcticus TaxID=2668039 RepID=A0A4Q9GU10_9MICO|nr:GNAT family N-acetyltransferase [Glaciihabitans arcticus]TBN56637.1 GNAT family N-acetyltransferase [Glaciihabitans arcticus]
MEIDATSAANIAEKGLRFELVDTADTEKFGLWLQADGRGFHSPRFTPETAAEYLAGTADRRTSAVYDDSSAEPGMPVATVNSWATPLTVPGEHTIEGWAISSVTVASTHRRKGIARNLLEAELRAAKAQNLPLAMLTVSESTIYGRFGFAPSTLTADYDIDTRKAKWTGPTPGGRVHFVPVEQLREEAPAIIERARLKTPGEILTWPHLWDRTFGISTDDKDFVKKVRAVRYDDADGTPQGFALYTFMENDHDFGKHTAEVRSLVTATDDAYAGLWSYLLELDLTTKLRVPLRSVDEPIRWQVSDFRAVRSTDVRDHLWLRILDVEAALEGREYSAPLDVVIEVTDELGFAAGRYRVTHEGVHGTSDSPDLELSVNELGAIYLGGVSALTLARAGRIQQHTAGSVDALERAFHSPIAPSLSVWF